MSSAADQPRLVLVRHGQIQANVAGLWHGETDSSLTPTGRRQARRLSRHMEKMEAPFAALYSSPLQRCTTTALPIARRLKLAIHTEPGLREYTLGEWEGMAFSDLARHHDFFRRSTRDPEFAPPGGESLAGAATRIVGTLDRIASVHEAGDRVLVICHGAILAVALASLIDGDAAVWGNYQFGNCSLTEISLKPTPVVHRFNETHHAGS